MNPSKISFASFLAVVVLLPNLADGQPRYNESESTNEDFSRFPCTRTTSSRILPADDPTTELELSVSARQLSTENSICLLYKQRRDTSEWIEYGTTEPILGTRDPNFKQKIVIPFHYWEKQEQLKFQIYNYDTSTSTRNTKSLGYAISNLAQIIFTNKGSAQLELQPIYSTGSSILISLAEVPTRNKQVIFQLTGHSLSKSSFNLMPKLNPYLEIYKANDDYTDYTLVHRTEVVRNTTDPKWSQFVLSLKALSDGDINRKLKFVCCNSNIKESPEAMGEFETSVEDVHGGIKSFSLKHPGKKSSKSFGSIYFDVFLVLKDRSFLDYIINGLPIHTFVAIDYSALNWTTDSIPCLHDTDQALNPYEKAISSVISVLEDYDDEKRIPVYGFPVIIPSKYKRPSGSDTTFYEDLFHVNLDVHNPVCVGLEGILKAYRRSIPVVKYYDSVDPSDVLEEIEGEIRRTESSKYKGYYVVLVLTTGQIRRKNYSYGDNHFDDSIKKIKSANALPMSIIFGGIGDWDFRDLEAFEEVGRAWREFVQFVPFNKYTSQNAISASAFAKETLAQIPRQLITYMLRENIAPSTPQQSDSNLKG